MEREDWGGVLVLIIVVAVIFSAGMALAWSWHNFQIEQIVDGKMKIEVQTWSDGTREIRVVPATAAAMMAVPEGTDNTSAR